QVVFVFAGHLVADTRAARAQGGVDEVVFVFDVALGQLHQFDHAVAGAVQLGFVGRVGAADGEQGIAHGGAQRLVDAGVEVEAAFTPAGGFGDGGDFDRVRVHVGSSERRRR